MTEPTTAAPASPAKPATREEHVARAMALSNSLIATANAAAEDESVVLDALLNAYLNAANHYGRSTEAAQCLVQTGSEFLVRTALARHQAGIDPFSTPPVVH
jgi:hypothetical protein